MIDSLYRWFSVNGVPSTVAYYIIRSAVVLVVIGLSYVANRLTRKFLLSTISYIAGWTRSQWDDLLVEKKVFHYLSHMAPAVVVYLSAPFFDGGAPWIQRVVLAYMVGVGIFVINALLNVVHEVYLTLEVSERQPIKGYVQIVKIFIAIIGSVMVIAMVLDKSPWGLLSGIGAMTAIILLIFKDSILGFVASIQLTAYNMVRRGDWIEMPKYGIDGEVIDVSLHTIKVQNWDKTISTIPTYALTSDSFKNWRGMSESGGRRIKRAVMIDMTTIKFCTQAMLERFSRFQLISDFIAHRLAEITAYNEQRGVDEREVVNGRRMTNIGVFRYYVDAYLRAHPKVHNDMTFMVRQLPPTSQGLPIEVYVFSNDQAWTNYEAIQADIFDHILAVIPQFDLQVYQLPSGHDLKRYGDPITQRVR